MSNCSSPVSSCSSNYDQSGEDPEKPKVTNDSCFINILNSNENLPFIGQQKEGEQCSQEPEEISENEIDRHDLAIITEESLLVLSNETGKQSDSNRSLINSDSSGLDIDINCPEITEQTIGSGKASFKGNGEDMQKTDLIRSISMPSQLSNKKLQRQPRRRKGRRTRKKIVSDSNNEQDEISHTIDEYCNDRDSELDILKPNENMEFIAQDDIHTNLFDKSDDFEQ